MDKLPVFKRNFAAVRQAAQVNLKGKIIQEHIVPVCAGSSVLLLELIAGNIRSFRRIDRPGNCVTALDSRGVILVHQVNLCGQIRNAEAVSSCLELRIRLQPNVLIIVSSQQSRSIGYVVCISQGIIELGIVLPERGVLQTVRAFAVIFVVPPNHLLIQGTPCFDNCLPAIAGQGRFAGVNCCGAPVRASFVGDLQSDRGSLRNNLVGANQVPAVNSQSNFNGIFQTQPKKRGLFRHIDRKGKSTTFCFQTSFLKGCFFRKVQLGNLLAAAQNPAVFIACFPFGQ